MGVVEREDPYGFVGAAQAAFRFGLRVGGVAAPGVAGAVEAEQVGVAVVGWVQEQRLFAVQSSADVRARVPPMTGNWLPLARPSRTPL